MVVPMVELKLKGCKLELYEGCKELPVINNHELNKLAFYDMGVGSSPESFNSHFAKLNGYLANHKSEDAIQEMRNLYRGFFNAINKIGTWSLSFVPFIKSIDGKEYEVSDNLEKCKSTLYDLSKAGLTTGQCEEIINDLKKKLMTNLHYTFLTDMAMMETQTYLKNLNDKIGQ